ncbi:hypothetical protein CCR75_003397 [Bremia lactucae]|uniref:Uncharacterized protein n=1 Tax=Bremia lactucae TaxID=4779 RepID=A0A976NY25_BRELC|nr:hypothetical protein CCR75_003397 [Bremia lactucae]
MGLVAFLTCGVCASRRKSGNGNFTETITIPTPAVQPHNAALAHHHAYDVDGSPAPAAHGHINIVGDGHNGSKNEPRRDRRSSNPQQSISFSQNRVSSGQNRGSSGPNRISSGPNRPSTGRSRTSSAQQRAHSGSRSQPQHSDPRSHPQQHERNGRPAVRSIEPVIPDKVRLGTGSSNSGTSGNNRDLDISDRSKEVASKVLEQFQTDPTLGQMRIAYSSLYFTRVLSKGAFGERIDKWQ